MKFLKLFLVSVVLFLSVTACMSSVLNNLNSPTDTPEAAVQVDVPTDTPEAAVPKPSGIITGVTLAKGSDPVSAAPKNPSKVFGTNDVIHAVVKISKAPANTKFTANWYVVDDGGGDAANTLITGTDLTADGTRYLDFTLTPTSSWPAGTYRVEISVNGQLDQTAIYTVK
jgi:hypothetical protein